MTFRVWNQTETYLKPTYQHTYVLTYLCDSSESRDNGDINDRKTQFAAKLNHWNCEQQQSLYKKKITAKKNLATLFFGQKNGTKMFCIILFWKKSIFWQNKICDKK